MSPPGHGQGPSGHVGRRNPLGLDTVIVDEKLAATSRVDVTTTELDGEAIREGLGTNSLSGFLIVFQLSDFFRFSVETSDTSSMDKLQRGAMGYGD